MSVGRQFFARLVRPLGFATCLLLLFGACRIQERIADRGKRPTPLPQGVDPNDVIDAAVVTDAADPMDPVAIAQIFRERQADALRERREREMKAGKDGKGGKGPEPKEYNILVLSGGGVYGAYPAGMLCGWTASGKSPEEGGRPEFDVVTGISTGALIAPFAFLGSDSDSVIEDLYTNVRNPDVFEIRRSVRSFFAESLADNTPLRTRIDARVTYEMLSRVAAAHAKGRRLYVGSTNLDTKRLVVWDMGAIATRGTEEARVLFVNAIMASVSLPGFFPSVRFHVTIDGAPYEELHVDGGVTRSMFFRPPYIPASQAEAVSPTTLAGSNLYAIVAGKIYPDPEGVRARTVAIVGAAVSGLLYATTRGDLYRFYTYCMLTGMNFFVAAIPPDLKVTNSSTNFDPVETRKMFAEGYQRGAQGAFTRGPRKDPKSPTDDPQPYKYADGKPVLFKVPGPGWRNLPPGLDVGERIENRAGLNLVVRKPQESAPRPQGTDQKSGGAPPVTK